MDVSYSSFPKYFFKILQFITAYPDSCFNIFIVPQKKVLTEKYFTKGKLEHSLQTETLLVIPFSEVFRFFSQIYTVSESSQGNGSESSHQAIQKLGNAKLLKINMQ